MIDVNFSKNPRYWDGLSRAIAGVVEAKMAPNPNPCGMGRGQQDAEKHSISSYKGPEGVETLQKGVSKDKDKSKSRIFTRVLVKHGKGAPVGEQQSFHNMSYASRIERLEAMAAAEAAQLEELNKETKKKVNNLNELSKGLLKRYVRKAVKPEESSKRKGTWTIKDRGKTHNIPMTRGHHVDRAMDKLDGHNSPRAKIPATPDVPTSKPKDKKSPWFKEEFLNEISKGRLRGYVRYSTKDSAKRAKKNPEYHKSRKGQNRVVGVAKASEKLERGHYNARQPASSYATSSGIKDKVYKWRHQRTDKSKIAEANWIQGAIKHPGAEKRAAAKAGMSTHAYMEKHKHDSGKSGSRARLGLTLSKMHH